VYETVLPEPGEISHDLVAIDPTKPAHVVAWLRTDQIRRLRQGTVVARSSVPEGWVTQAPYDIWATVVPRLKSFCQAFSKAHDGHMEQLILRLEQRLGLPPGSGKTAFVEILVKDPSIAGNLFRPCVVPSVATTTCPLGPPDASTSQQYKNWFFSQYYSSYALARPTQYPWTSLGYTFDWGGRGTGMGDTDFVRTGESEFVIPKGGMIQIESVTGTAEYCAQP
jgi:hypothetical protein